MSLSLCSIASELTALRRRPPRLLGRAPELAALRAAIEARRSVFISGAAGVGKSAVLQALFGTWHDDEACRVLYCRQSATRRNIATHLLVNLHLVRGSLRSEYLGRSKTVTSLSGLRRFVSDDRLPDLARMLNQTLGEEPVVLLLDHLDQPDPRVARWIEVWLERRPLVLCARDPADVGRARWLLSACEPLTLRPLSAAMLVQLGRHLVASQGASIEEQDLHEAVVRAAGNPGRLEATLRAAAQPKYRRGGRLQWRPLDLDLRIAQLELRMSAQRSRTHQ